MERLLSSVLCQFVSTSTIKQSLTLEDVLYGQEKAQLSDDELFVVTNAGLILSSVEDSATPDTIRQFYRSVSNTYAGINFLLVTTSIT